MCASKQLVVNLKTEFRKLMPKIKHRHFDEAADKKLVDEIVSQLTVIEEELEAR